MEQDKLWNSNYLKIWWSNFLINFSFVLIVPLLPLYLSETFAASKDTIGVALAGYSVVALLVRPFSGYIVDNFPRKVVLLICQFFFVAIFLGYLVAGSLVAFTIFRTLHGAPFGAVTVAASTVAIDVLPSSRRGEGIGYYGLSNNLALAIGPMLAVYILHAFGGNYNALFWLSTIVSLLGLILESTIKLRTREYKPEKRVISLDRFFLINGWREAIGILLVSISYGILSTYVAIYGKEEMEITEGTGLFFGFFAIGLIISRLTGAKALRENRVAYNAAIGLSISVVGYLIFASVHNQFGYYLTPFIIGLGNGHMYPAFQTMFINLAPADRRGTANSSILTAWDAGMGIGVLIGGIAAQLYGYHFAFCIALVINASAVLYFFTHIRGHFENNKLR